MNESFPEKPETTPETAEFMQVYRDYTAWLPEEEIGYCGFHLIPLERYVGDEEPNSEAINDAEYRRIQCLYMEYVVSLSPERASIAAKHLLHTDNWEQVLQELERGMTQ